MMLKVLNSGRLLDGLPAPAVLEHEESPREIVEALAAYRVAREALKEPEAGLRAAQKTAREAILAERGSRDDAEERARTNEERQAVTDAERLLVSAARRLDEALDTHADDVSRIAALLALQAHARAVEAALDLEAARSDFQAFRGGRYGLRPDLDPVLVTRRKASNVRDSALSDLDAVDAHALADRAGTRLDLVEVRDMRGGALVLTTPRRAAALTARGSSWMRVDEEVSA